MSDHIKRVLEMRQYIDRTPAVRMCDKHLDTCELLLLGEVAKEDFYGGILLAVKYGIAVGYRAARGKVVV